MVTMKFTNRTVSTCLLIKPIWARFLPVQKQLGLQKLFIVNPTDVFIVPMNATRPNAIRLTATHYGMVISKVEIIWSFSAQLFKVGSRGFFWDKGCADQCQ